MVRLATLPDRIRFPGMEEQKIAREISDRLPRLVLEAHHVAKNLTHGSHARRQSGFGESFWQFRPYAPGESANQIDWRRSARDRTLYVREREGESAQTINLWIDRSLSMAYASSLARFLKVERAIVLGLALAEVLVSIGERVGYMGLLDPQFSPHIGEKIAVALRADFLGAERNLPPLMPLKSRSKALLIGDFIVPIEEIERNISSISSNGAHGHVLLIVDPAEEIFPFSGQTELVEPENDLRLHLGEAAVCKEDYQKRMKAHREELRTLLTRYGFTLTIHHTDRPASEAALNMLRLFSSRYNRVR